MTQPNFEPIAEEALQTLDLIETIATEKLRSIGNASAESFANANTFTGSQAVQNLSNINEHNRAALDQLKKEPALIRLVVEHEDGVRETLYIARKTQVPLTGDIKLASYDSPKGRLASAVVGNEKIIVINGNSTTYYIVEKLYIHPQKKNTEWDSYDGIYVHDSFGSFTIESLRNLLQVSEVDFSDELDKLLAQDDVNLSIKEGIGHQIRTAMGLRDQPILDQFQDEIFRLPLDSQLIILGPPGTGKTTTLIKRLGQKLDLVYLDDSEQSLVQTASRDPSHNTSWLMFTPSDLLKHYLKEAFNRELVPASDDRIKTWNSYRSDLARNNLGILKSANGGKFTLKAEFALLSDNVVHDAREWYGAFKKFHWERLLEQLTEGGEQVDKSSTNQSKSLVSEIYKVLEVSNKLSPVALLQRLDSLEKLLKTELDANKTLTDEMLKKERNFLYNRDKNVFTDLANFLDAIEQDDDEDEDVAFDDETDDQNQPSRSEVERAVRAYLAFLRTYSRHLYLSRSLNKQSRAGKVKDWLGERVPSKEVLLQMGQQITLQNGLRRFLNVPKRYVFDVVTSYRVFRKLHEKNKNFYQNTPNQLLHIDGNELDGLILLMLQNARELLSQNFVARNLDESKFNALKDVNGILKNQIMVDEATDFSMLQLACMGHLASIKTNSFFACGDFNQRITNQGVRDISQLYWMIPNISEHRINTVYRQSRFLNEFAKTLLEISHGDTTALGQLPESSTHQGCQPALVENIGDISKAADWIALRIKQIEETVNQLPTIAVLVNDEAEVKPMAKALTDALEDVNLKAVACEEGKSLGEGVDVRVFDIQHIKGLEFEAVFFAGVDKLATQKPKLFDRYLYVGATRAATYLGMVSFESLPERLNSIRSQCVSLW